MIELIDQIRKEIECCCSWTRYETIMGLLLQMEIQLDREKNMWDHYCTRERSEMSVGKGEPCNWCGLTEEENE